MNRGTAVSPIDVVARMVESVAAACPSPDSVADAILDVLLPAVRANVGLLIRVDLTTHDAAVHGRSGRGPISPLLRHHLRASAPADPLMTSLAGGDLRPRTALRVLGREAWQRSPARSFGRDHLGIDQVATLPVQGSVQSAATFILGRNGPDFDEHEVALLSAVQPVVVALESMLRLERVRAQPEHVPMLTPREREVLTLLARGYKAAAIGRLIGCSPRTVHRHLANLYTKLTVGDRLMAVTRARELGLISAGGE